MTQRTQQQASGRERSALVSVWLDPKTRKQVTERARDSERSISGQMRLYVTEGLKRDQRHARETK